MFFWNLPIYLGACLGSPSEQNFQSIPSGSTKNMGMFNHLTTWNDVLSSVWKQQVCHLLLEHGCGHLVRRNCGLSWNGFPRVTWWLKEWRIVYNALRQTGLQFSLIMLYAGVWFWRLLYLYMCTHTQKMQYECTSHVYGSVRIHTDRSTTTRLHDNHNELNMALTSAFRGRWPKSTVVPVASTLVVLPALISCYRDDVGQDSK